MKYLCLAATLCAAAASAQPMWEIAPKWECNLERHMRAPTGADVVEMDPTGRAYQIDFAAKSVTSAFVDGTADIVQTSHHAANELTYNIVVNAWSFGTYPSVYMERGGEAWSVGGSGTLNDGDDVWVAVYHCLPAKPGA